MFLKGPTIPHLDDNDVGHESRRVQAYSYDNASALSVFGLALIAAAGALCLVWAASSGLKVAAENEWIAHPPELKLLTQ